VKDGFFGGTFDPPHLGHLALAQEALEKYSLEKVFFVPTHIPPHKTTCPVTEFSHRIQMLELAIEGNPCFQIADLESDGVPSYTVDMLQRLSIDGFTPWFIIGMDSLLEIHTWKQPSRIFDLARVVAGTRPGFNADSVAPDILKRVSLFEFPGVWISSSELRARVRAGRRISYLVPWKVESYIRSRGLYGAAESY
jgi:nicotinate-nucleotide adenylyltransferase